MKGRAISIPVLIKNALMSSIPVALVLILFTALRTSTSETCLNLKFEDVNFGKFFQFFQSKRAKYKLFSIFII